MTDALSVNTSTTNAFCWSGNGSATLIPVGGTPPYSGQFHSGSIQAYGLAVSLPAGSYNASLVDKNSCVVNISSILITQPGIVH